MHNRHYNIFRCQYMRNEDQQPSRWLPAMLADEADADTIKHCFCINSSARLSRLLYENEFKKNIKFRIEEGLVRSHKTSKFIDAFKSFAEKNVPSSLKQLKYSDLWTGEDNDRVFITVDRTEEHDAVSAMTAFVVLAYAADLQQFEQKLKKFVDDAYIFGYDLAAVDRIQHDLMPDVAVLRVQFEARFSNDKFKLADVLLHVAPKRLLDKIKKNGLVPKSKSSEFKYEDRVYLFNQCKQSKVVEYGKYKAAKSNDNGFCVFKIQRRRLEDFPLYKNGKLKFYVDAAFAVDNGIDVEAVFTYGNIPAKLLDDECLIFNVSANGISSQTRMKFK